MSFEIVEPGAYRLPTALAEDQAALDRRGCLTLHASALRWAGIGARALLLADGGTLRVALKPTHGPEDEARSVALSTIMRGKRERHDSGRRRCNITRALNRLGLTAAACAGRFPVMTKGSEGDGILIVALTPAGDGAAKD